LAEDANRSPLYYNEKYNFYALSRYDDVARGLPDWETYRSGRGTTADILFSGIEVPPGILLFEDPPLHDLHRRLLSRVFTCVISVRAHWIHIAIPTGLTSSPTSARSCQCGRSDGTRRPLERTEVLAYTAMIAGAVNETTARLIGFMGQLLGEHPDNDTSSSRMGP
jgi:cytochrome P450